MQIPELLFKMIDYIVKRYIDDESLTGVGKRQRNLKQPKKQCKNKESILDVNIVKAKNMYPMGQVQIDVMFGVSSEKIYQKEYLIYDGHNKPAQFHFHQSIIYIIYFREKICWS